MLKSILTLLVILLVLAAIVVQATTSVAWLKTTAQVAGMVVMCAYLVYAGLTNKGRR